MATADGLANGPHAEELAALEDEAARVVGKPIRDALNRALAIVAQLQAKTKPTRYAIERDRREVAAIIRHTPLSHVRAALATYVSKAFDLGAEQAMIEFSGTRPKGKKRKARHDADLMDVLTDTSHHAAANLILGAQNAEKATTVDALLTATAQGMRAATGSEAAARWAVNRSAARGADSICSELGAARLWIAERDACLHCLAYSGVVAQPGERFPAGLTFAEKPLKSEAIPYPPLHPNCRCRITPWLGTKSGSGTSVEMPEALKREARRSVLLGLALPSESTPARLRAADRLLAKGAMLPASVQARARAAVRRGAFGRKPAL
jgi:hypothetical protein